MCLFMRTKREARKKLPGVGKITGIISFLFLLFVFNAKGQEKGNDLFFFCFETRKRQPSPFDFRSRIVSESHSSYRRMPHYPESKFHNANFSQTAFELDKAGVGQFKHSTGLT